MTKSFEKFNLVDTYSVGTVVYLGNFDQAQSVVCLEGTGLSGSPATSIEIIESEDGLNWDVLATAIPISNGYSEHGVSNRKKHLAYRVASSGASSVGSYTVSVREA